MLCTFWKQDFLLVFSVAIIHMEISNWFVNARWLFFKHGWSGASLVQGINSVLLFIAFMFGRVIFQLYIVFFFQLPWLNKLVKGDTAQIEYKVLAVEVTILLFCNVLMNLYWASLIVNQLRRLLARGFGSDSVEAGGLDTNKKDVEMQKDPILAQDAQKEE